jgi:hypothetical protein
MGGHGDRWGTGVLFVILSLISIASCCSLYPPPPLFSLSLPCYIFSYPLIYLDLSSSTLSLHLVRYLHPFLLSLSFSFSQFLLSNYIFLSVRLSISSFISHSLSPPLPSISYSLSPSLNLRSVFRGINMFAMLTGRLPFLVDPPTNLTKLHALILKGCAVPEELSSSEYSHRISFLLFH